MAIVSDITDVALRLCGVRVPGATREAEALSALNLMLKDWEENMLIPTKEDLTLVVGQSEYTIGTGGDFDTTRPESIMSAYILDSDYYSYGVDVFMAPQDYDKVSLKIDEARPNKLYYAAAFSSELATIYFNSEPETAETFVLTSFKGITEYDALTDTVVQPPEYEKCMAYNLAIDLAPEYSIQLMTTVIQQAIIMKAKIESRNLKVPLCELDNAILR